MASLSCCNTNIVCSGRKTIARLDVHPTLLEGHHVYSKSQGKYRELFRLHLGSLLDNVKLIVEHLL